MKNISNNPYGYKICYREEGFSRYVKHFMTKTYKEAIKAESLFTRFPPRSREDNHILVKPKWVIIPIKHSEIKDGIWFDDPF